jgi:hypothetical protein
MQRKTIQKQFISIVAILLMGIVALQLVNKSVYLHSHVLPDGRLVAHSHPYDKAADDQPFKSHHHKQTEFVLLELLNLLYRFSLSGLVLVGFIAGFTYIHSSHFSIIERVINKLNDRAPPACFALSSF